MDTPWLPALLLVWITALAGRLDARQQARFVRLSTGLIFARGRRTASSWFRAAGVGRDFRAYYYFLAALGRRAEDIARRLVLYAVLPLLARGRGRLLFGLDDTPTRRFGPKVQGAGTHHDPAPKPAAARFLYGAAVVAVLIFAPYGFAGIARRLWRRPISRARPLPAKESTA